MFESRNPQTSIIASVLRWLLLQKKATFEDFDPDFYHQCYPDMTATTSESKLRRHYAKYGQKEGRFKNAQAAIRHYEACYFPLPSDFDCEDYKNLNNDLSVIFKHDWQFKIHYLECGCREGRHYKVRPNASLDELASRLTMMRKENMTARNKAGELSARTVADEIKDKDCAMVNDDVLDVIFLALFQRLARQEEKAMWSHKAEIGTVIASILKSVEFAAHVPNLVTPYMLRMGSPHVTDTNIFYNLLARAPLSETQIHDLILSHYLSGDYYEFHKKRFSELHGLIAEVNSKRPIRRLLEISTMPYTTGVWKLYLEELNHLATVDLPSSQGGPKDADVINFGSNRHVEIDLNHANLDELSRTITETGPFDLIIATEVVEHLQRDFSEIAELLLKCLSPDGLIIVTTPNPIRENAILFLINGHNPQHKFKGFNANHGGHFHFREYSRDEMNADIKTIGGETFLQVYSDCWFNDRVLYKSEDRYHLRTNIVIVFGHPEASNYWKTVFQ